MTHAWEATAAYFYVLHLDRPCLAWEYLRRNQVYRREWQQRDRHPDATNNWGCTSFEDPALDARSAAPQWLDEPAQRVDVVRSKASRPADHRFSIWTIAGQRELSHTGMHLTLRTGGASGSLQVRMDAALSDGEPYAFVVRADGLLGERLRVVEQAAERIQRSNTRINLTKRRRVDRTALTHARTLQALDGVQTGASQRDIAVALFGLTSVRERWSADGELRAQVRYLLRRGQALINGGYRQLVVAAVGSQQGES